LWQIFMKFPTFFSISYGMAVKWFDIFFRRMRLKKTIATTRANDYNAQVIVAQRDDHRRMIETFFALKVWVLEAGFTLPRN